VMLEPVKIYRLDAQKRFDYLPPRQKVLIPIIYKFREGHVIDNSRSVTDTNLLFNLIIPEKDPASVI
jgi:hypothetical protein